MTRLRSRPLISSFLLVVPRFCVLEISSEMGSNITSPLVNLSAILWEAIEFGFMSLDILPTWNIFSERRNPKKYR